MYPGRVANHCNKLAMAARQGRRFAQLHRLWSSPSPASCAGALRTLSSISRDSPQFAKERDRALSIRTLMQRQAAVDQPRIALLAEIRNEPGLPLPCASCISASLCSLHLPHARVCGGGPVALCSSAGGAQHVTRCSAQEIDLVAPRRRALQAPQAV